MNPYKPRVKAPDPHLIEFTRDILKNNEVNTICEAGSCPNRTECYSKKTATFMILGDICTRACKFCNVKTGKGLAIDLDEPSRVAKAISELGLDYLVLTSVDRDDLFDYGASHFASCVSKIKEKNPDIKIELLTPDFKANKKSLDIIVSTGVEKLSHNQETVRRLSDFVRPQSSYEISLKTLEYYTKNSSSIIKSSLMLGLGETKKEIIDTMKDLLSVGVSELSIGQYLQPSPKHHMIKKYYSKEFFDNIRQEALAIGFKSVASGILVRSSYNAKDL
ncbi:MAG: lipoyl synthase [Sulfurimonas sp.]|nr:MAG: lipoyl synthase [Sulfurimonas sp.]